MTAPMGRLPGIVLRQTSTVTFSGQDPQDTEVDFSALDAFSKDHGHVVTRLGFLFPGGVQETSTETGSLSETGTITQVSQLNRVVVSGAAAPIATSAATANAKDNYSHTGTRTTTGTRTAQALKHPLPFLTFTVSTFGGRRDAAAYGQIQVVREHPWVDGNEVPHLVFPPGWKGKMTVKHFWQNPSTAPSTAARVHVVMRQVRKSVIEELLRLLDE